jgi:pSer/pThr/pTyr-binding forkhead associated (FHA) protein
MSGIVLTALNPDGAEAGSYALPKGDSTIGRDTADFFSADPFLSPKHATFSAKNGKVVVEDCGSLNGVFRKLLAEQPCTLADGQVFRIGQELIRYEALGENIPDQHGVELMGGPMDGVVGRICMVIGRETAGTAFPMSENGISLGRERGEVLFPEDGYVSGLHCRLSYDDGQVYVTDLGSSNGTFVRLDDAAELSNGDILLMGQQLYRVTV